MGSTQVECELKQSEGGPKPNLRPKSRSGQNYHWPRLRVATIFDQMSAMAAGRYLCFLKCASGWNDGISLEGIFHLFTKITAPQYTCCKVAATALTSSYFARVGLPIDSSA